MMEVHAPEEREQAPVQHGDTVSISVKGHIETYKIVDPLAGSDPREGEISARTPLGAALLGARMGERVEVQAPGGIYTVEIVAIDK